MNQAINTDRFAAGRVSVVIPCYNHGEFLEAAIASVRAQDYPDIEIIVVNDGSTDPQTLAVLKALEEDVKLIERPNEGLSTARNRGIQASNGEYILPLDADDRIAPGYVGQAVAVMEQDANVGIVYGLTELFGAKSGLWPQPEFSVPDMLLENLIVATALFRKADWECVGGYRPAMRHAWEDWDFWLALIALGRQVVRLETVTFFYRIGHHSMTRRLSYRHKLVMMAKIVVRHRCLYLANWRRVLYRVMHPGMRKVADPRT